MKRINLAGKPVEIAIRHCETQDAAVALFKKHYLQIGSCGGAITIGDSRPAMMSSAQEIAHCAKHGLDIPKNEPFWIEVVVFRSVTFQQMLDYITLVDYGIDSNHDPELVRAKAYGILATANTIGPMCFDAITRYIVSVKYLVPLPKDTLLGIIESALTFNETYFTMDLGRKEWRRQFCSSNGFALGPG
jgi:hypothetical protein